MSLHFQVFALDSKKNTIVPPEATVNLYKHVWGVETFLLTFVWKRNGRVTRPQEMCHISSIVTWTAS